MEKKEKGANIFGRFFSNRELFWNGIAFLLIGVFYEAISLGNQLPLDWKENVDVISDVEVGWLIPTIFFIVSYFLFNRRFFGENLQEIIDKLGYGGYFLRKLSLIMGLVLINLILKSITLVMLF